ncbi:MAG: hypothetical protein IH861_01715 [Chloroflexi bacterium]|nr:hypothetical protein [Chloroflexota bacterium]
MNRETDIPLLLISKCSFQINAFRFPRIGDRGIHMDARNIAQLQSRAAKANVELFDSEFHWCQAAIELMIDTHAFLGSKEIAAGSREEQYQRDPVRHDVMNTIINLSYDAGGSLISALRLVECGLIADAWSLIRVAFETTSYSEFFAFNPSKLRDYSSVESLLVKGRIEGVKGKPLDVASEFAKRSIGVSDVRKALSEDDDFSRRDFYSRLSSLGTHASPLRPGLRIGIGEPEVRMYLSIGRRELRQCVADLAAVIKYALGIPFEHCVEFLRSSEKLTERYETLLVEYFGIYPPPVVPN